ncbi:Zinc metalloprotease ZmpC [Frankliniella fusca]|uniref:Zinc metalloprotease ZmpC n=1 Tax=Frankliniella fusca TaxID=407009 RepID=A0AAE1LGN7_9NEOP|nr:Zinc metalloprotease ZmpC [Frankliniella fusca]
MVRVTQQAGGDGPAEGSTVASDQQDGACECLAPADTRQRGHPGHRGIAQEALRVARQRPGLAVFRPQLRGEHERVVAQAPALRVTKETNTVTQRATYRGPHEKQQGPGRKPPRLDPNRVRRVRRVRHLG